MHAIKSLLIPGAVFAIWALCAVGAAEEPSAANPTEQQSPRSYVVFAGLDVFVERSGTRQSVVGGSETEVLVWDEQRNTTVPLRDVALSAAVEPRVARGTVSLDALRGYAVYSPANDPAAAAHAQQFFLLNLEGARAEESEVNARMAQAVSDSYSAIAPSVSPDSPGAAAFQAQMNEAASQAAAANDQMASTYANPIYRDSRVGSPQGEENFDGFAVAFQVSSPRPVNDVYGVLRLRVRTTSQPGAPFVHAIKMFRVRQLDAKPRKIVVRQFGLPPGFTLESYQVHLYADGRELATNASPNRVEVTEDEAHQFLILRHTQERATATIPAQVAAELRHELPPAISTENLGGVSVDFTISAAGKVETVNVGAAISDAVETEIGPAMRQVRFLPALVKGKPVESRGTFAVSELFLRTDENGRAR